MINKFYLLCVIFSGSPDLTLKTCLVYLCSRTCYYLLFPITMLKCNISYYRFYTCYNNTSWYASLRNLIPGNLMYTIFLRSCSFSGSLKLLGTRSWITLFVKYRHFSLSWDIWSRSLPSYPVSLIYILMCFHLRQELPSDLFSLYFSTKFLYAFLFSSIDATCPALIVFPE